MTDLSVVEIIGNSVDAATPNRISLLQTTPTAITFHRIGDHELDMLTNISRPISLGVATMAAGAVLGLLPSVLTFLDKVGTTHPVVAADVVILSVWAMCIATAIIMGILAGLGEFKARKIKRDIRSRPVTPF